MRSEVRTARKKMMNMLLINQLTIDLFTCIMAIPSYLVNLFNIYYTGTLGYLLCVTFCSETMMWVGLSASPINLAVIAIERYAKVVHCIWHKNHWKVWMFVVGCVLSWISGFGLNVVYILCTSSVSDGFCIVGTGFPNRSSLLTAAWFTFLYGDQLPFMVFIFSYIRIFITIRRQNRIFQQPQSASNQVSNVATFSTSTAPVHGSTLSKSEMNALKMIAVLTVFFVVSCFPVTVFYLVIQITELPPIWPLYYACEVFMIFSVAANPFMYAFGLPDIRGYLRSKIECREHNVGNNTVCTVGGVNYQLPKLSQK
jgi:hypothetical protein